MVDAERFQIVWVIGVRPNQITWVVGISLRGRGRKNIICQKKRSFIKSSQKKAMRAETAIFVHMQSSNLGCFRRILVKNGTEINSPMNYSQNVPKSKRPRIGQNIPKNWSQRPHGKTCWSKRPQNEFLFYIL